MATTQRELRDATAQGFAARVVQWQSRHGRHYLPWQNTSDPYRIWLSEIMLQQTQVATVIDYFQRFIERFPTVAALAQADIDEVMPYWAGLGYYARARNLHRCAQEIAGKWNGQFPRNPDDIMTLPGIGRSTAGAIAAFSWGCRTPIMDGNVKRVFTRYFAIAGYPGTRAVDTRLWELAWEVLNDAPKDLNMQAYTQGLMDLGAGPCGRRNPNCAACPLHDGCLAREQGLQNQLPTPKPRTALPERSCHMLLWVRNNHVLLQRRPAQGIWGGLWSLPEFETYDTLAQFCTNQGVELRPEAQLATLQHTFTHYRLNIHPWLLNVEDTTNEPAGPDQNWLSMDALETVGMPAPVSKLLSGIGQSTLLL